MYNCPGLLITDIRISRWCHKENSIQLFHIENYFVLCVVATGGCFYVFFKQIHAEFSFKTYDVLILLKINCIIVTMPVILQVYDDNITDVHNNETAIEVTVTVTTPLSLDHFSFSKTLVCVISSEIFFDRDEHKWTELCT